MAPSARCIENVNARENSLRSKEARRLGVNDVHVGPKTSSRGADAIGGMSADHEKHSFVKAVQKPQTLTESFTGQTIQKPKRCRLTAESSIPPPPPESSETAPAHRRSPHPRLLQIVFDICTLPLCSYPRLRSACQSFRTASRHVAHI